MEITHAIHQCLSWLFSKYLESPDQSWNLYDASLDPGHMLEAVNVMAAKGYVKNLRTEENALYCSITTLGIMQINNDVHEVQYKILEGYIEERKTSLMEILKAEPWQFRRIQDYAMYLKQTGVIECIFGDEDIQARATFFGQEWYRVRKVMS